MGTRDSAYHLYGVAGQTATQQQDQFRNASYIEQPKHPHFDLGIQINYKKLDRELAGQRGAPTEKEKGNLYSPLLGGR